jgi:hypothetical protein
MTDLLNLGDVELETRGLKGTVFTFLGALIPLRGWRSCQWKVCKQGSLLTEPWSPSLGFHFAVVLAFLFRLNTATDVRGRSANRDCYLQNHRHIRLLNYHHLFFLIFFF